MNTIFIMVSVFSFMTSFILLVFSASQTLFVIAGVFLFVPITYVYRYTSFKDVVVKKEKEERTERGNQKSAQPTGKMRWVSTWIQDVFALGPPPQQSRPRQRQRQRQRPRQRRENTGRRG
jgi:uncharacterized membrane protein